jgi:hypothetical protein
MSPRLFVWGAQRVPKGRLGSLPERLGSLPERLGLAQISCIDFAMVMFLVVHSRWASLSGRPAAVT